MKLLCHKKIAGFTLIELVLVIMLVSIVAGIGSVVMSNGLQAYISYQNISAADWEIRLALETMTREIRNIRYPSDISVASATQLSFVNNNGQSITFSLSGTNLLENSQILASGVTSMAFTYYTSALTAATTPSTVVLIQLDITFSNNNMKTTTQLFWFPRNAIP